MRLIDDRMVLSNFKQLRKVILIQLLPTQAVNRIVKRACIRFQKNIRLPIPNTRFSHRSLNLFSLKAAKQRKMIMKLTTLLGAQKFKNQFRNSFSERRVPLFMMKFLIFWNSILKFDIFFMLAWRVRWTKGERESSRKNTKILWVREKAKKVESWTTEFNSVPTKLIWSIFFIFCYLIIRIPSLSFFFHGSSYTHTIFHSYFLFNSFGACSVCLPIKFSQLT